MATITKHVTGTFCWPELGTTNQDAAKKFYGSIFGWTANDVPMGQGAVYTIFKNQGKDCAALYTLMPEMLKQGVPPNWGAYIAVPSADQAAKKAAELGGKVLLEPMDVMGTLGRLATIQDPTGAVFSVWEAKDHPGVGVLEEPGALCWTELMTNDTAKAEAFYKALIGWTAETMPMGDSNYTMFMRADGVKAGGMMKVPVEGMPPHWTGYFHVADINAVTNQVKSLGGQVIKPVSQVPNKGQFAFYADPQGAVFAAFQPTK